MNKSLASGVYPDMLKVARVTPVYKGGSRELSGSYRPISVLSAINKVYETVLANRLKGFLGSEGLIYNHQYGFRDKSSTATAASELLDCVYQNLDRKGCNVVSALFIDLRKAFDSVNHALLLRKLYVYGIRGPAYDVLRSYLSDRSQFVSINGVTSSTRLVTCGVPQRSVLGPILFPLFLNDIARLSLHGNLYLYADDACLIYPGADDTINCNQMTEDLHTLSVYFANNRFTLNVSKTKYMHMHTGSRPLARTVLIRYQGEVVEEVQEFCYLGVYLDSRLTWRRHVNYLCTMLSRMVGIFFKIRHEIPRYALMKLYFALVHSHLIYIVTLWANAPVSSLSHLQALQNRLLKIPIMTSTNLDVYH